MTEEKNRTVTQLGEVIVQDDAIIVESLYGAFRITLSADRLLIMSNGMPLDIEVAEHLVFVKVRVDEATE
jgi:hypothetical protein